MYTTASGHACMVVACMRHLCVSTRRCCGHFPDHSLACRSLASESSMYFALRNIEKGMIQEEILSQELVTKYPSQTTFNKNMLNQPTNAANNSVPEPNIGAFQCSGTCTWPPTHSEITLPLVRLVSGLSSG